MFNNPKISPPLKNRFPPLKKKTHKQPGENPQIPNQPTNQPTNHRLLF